MASVRYLLLALLLVTVLACDEDDPMKPSGPQPVALRPPTTPENLLYNLQVLYNDTLRTKDDRVAAFADLLASNFIFRFQPVDFDSCGCTDWGREEEIEAHEKLFGKQASGEIYSISLQITHEPAQDLDPPDPNRPGWKRIFATTINLEVLTSPGNGFAVHGAQADFLFSPSGDRWFIAGWTDLPRPEPEAVESSSWGRIKLVFYR